MVSPLLDQLKSKLVWKTTCARENKYRVKWTAILTKREGWKTNKELLKGCQTSEYQYASVNCTQFWWVESSSLFQAFNYLGRSAKHDAQNKGGRSAVREGERIRIKPLPLFRYAVFSSCDPTNLTPGRGYDPSKARFFNHRLNAEI